MWSKGWLWIIVIGCLSLILSGMVKKGYGKDLPEEVIINNQYRTDLYESVLFRHTVHAFEFGIVCIKCHHAWDQEESGSNPQKCISCHAIKDNEKISLRNAYMKICKDCHRNLKKEEKPSGPTSCKGCHQKKKRRKKN